MKRYLKIYLSLLRINLIALFSYRANFINSTISSFIWGLFSVISILLLTSRTNSFFGWTRSEIIILAAVYSFLIGIFHMFFARNFERFSRLIHNGQIDTVLLKPLDSQFSISLWEFNYSSISRIIMGAILLIYLLFSISYVPSVLNIILFFIFVFLGIMIIYSLWMIASTFMIWVPQLTNIIDFMYSLNGLTKYPGEMYKRLSPVVFIFLLPLILVASSPFKILLNKANQFDVIPLFVISCSLLFFSRKFWISALKSYTSASN